VDDEPVSQFDFFSWLAAALGKPVPGAAPENSEAATTANEITNKKGFESKTESGTWLSFQIPTFREGYASEIEKLASAGK